MAAKRPNRFGLHGVKKTKNTFWSEITVKGQTHYLGAFKTAEEAHAAFVDKSNELRGEFSFYA